MWPRHILTSSQHESHLISQHTDSVDRFPSLLEIEHHIGTLLHQLKEQKKHILGLYVGVMKLHGMNRKSLYGSLVPLRRTRVCLDCVFNCFVMFSVYLS